MSLRLLPLGLESQRVPGAFVRVHQVVHALDLSVRQRQSFRRRSLGTPERKTTAHVVGCVRRTERNCTDHTRRRLTTKMRRQSSNG